MTQDEQHLNLLSIFHYVLGGITALFSCFPILHIILGLAMLTGGLDGEDAPPAFFAWFFIVFPAIMILCGWTLSVLMVITGVKIKKRAAYTFCLVIAAIECIFMPFGTVLGVLTLIVLTKEPVRKLFTGNASYTPPGAGTPSTGSW
jgi:energy-converting hydrogenase Eha subunit C